MSAIPIFPDDLALLREYLKRNASPSTVRCFDGLVSYLETFGPVGCATAECADFIVEFDQERNPRATPLDASLVEAWLRTSTFAGVTGVCH